MPILDLAAQEASLSNDYGPSRGPNAPAAFDVLLFDADPTLGGVEIAGGGYAPGSLGQNTDWLAPDGGVVRSVPVPFPDATGPWSTARYWVLVDPLTGIRWDYAPLTEPLDVTAAGPGPTVALAIFYTNNPS